MKISYKKSFLLFSIFQLCIFFLNAQIPIHIRGVVLDSTKKPINFAIVTVKKKDSTNIISYTTTDSIGFFFLQLNNQKEEIILSISALGFKNQVFNVILDKNKNQFIDTFILPSTNAQLPEVIVNANNAIEIKGDTTIFSVSAFKTGENQALGSLLEIITGFEVMQDGKIRFKGKPIDRILLEGDDLTGNEYSTLTKSLSINKLNKIEVINNFIDKDDILSEINKEPDRQVLNLRYDSTKNTLLNFELIVNYSLTDKKQVDNQDVLVNKKIKIINFIEVNSIGEKKVSQSEFVKSPNIQKLELDLIKPESLNRLLSDNNSPMYFFANLSNQVKSSVFTRVFKNIILKNDFGYMNDKLDSKQVSTTEYFIQFPSLLNQNTNQINDSRDFITNNILLRFRQKKNQIDLNYKLISKSINQINSGQIFSENFNATNHSRYFNNNIQISYSAILKRSFGITFGYNYNWGNLSKIMKLDSADYLKSFNTFSTLHELNETNTAQFKACKAYFSIVMAPSKKINFRLDLNNETTKLSSFSKLDLLDTTKTRYTISKDSTNNYILSLNSQNINFSGSFFLKKVSGEINLFYSFLNIGYKPESNFNYFLPSITVNFPISNKNNFHASFRRDLRNLDLVNFGNGLRIQNFNTLFYSSNSISINPNTGLNFTYSFTNFNTKKEILFAGLSIQKNSLNYIQNLLPTQYDNSIYYTANSDKILLLSFYTKYDRYLPKGLRFSPELNYNQLRFPNMISNQTFIIENKSLRLGFLISKKWSLGNNIAFSAFFTRNTSNSINQSTNTILGNNSSTIYYNLKNSFVFFKKITLESSMSLEKNSFPNQPSTNIFRDEHKFGVNDQKRSLNFYIWVRNVFDIKKYSIVNISANTSQTNETFIFPRLICIGMKFKF